MSEENETNATCPKCGAGFRGRTLFGHDNEETADSFLCGSTIYSTDGYRQSTVCFVAALSAELERIKTDWLNARKNIGCKEGESLTEKVVELLATVARLDWERAEATLLIESIVCVKNPDRGVVLLSSEGPTHYDPAVGCHVFDHENLSPLGDALIELHDKLTQPLTPES